MVLGFHPSISNTLPELKVAAVCWGAYLTLSQLSIGLRQVAPTEVYRWATYGDDDRQLFTFTLTDKDFTIHLRHMFLD